MKSTIRGNDKSNHKDERVNTIGHKHKNKNLRSSFKYAFVGIATGIRSERNMKIHLTMMIMVCAMGYRFKISVVEWCLCMVLFGMVIGMELINCSIEAVVDLVCPQMHPLAKKAKDTAAGAVLVVAISAAVIGLIIFIPKILVYVN